MGCHAHHCDQVGFSKCHVCKAPPTGSWQSQPHAPLPYHLAALSRCTLVQYTQCTMNLALWHNGYIDSLNPIQVQIVWVAAFKVEHSRLLGVTCLTRSLRVCGADALYLWKTHKADPGRLATAPGLGCHQLIGLRRRSFCFSLRPINNSSNGKVSECKILLTYQIYIFRQQLHQTVQDYWHALQSHQRQGGSSPTILHFTLRLTICHC